jgi:hypothetical protein
MNSYDVMALGLSRRGVHPVCAVVLPPRALVARIARVLSLYTHRSAVLHSRERSARANSSISAAATPLPPNSGEHPKKSQLHSGG